ncbi:MAG: T9SS type A sorting domain-containing protein [Bacteroidales bacterium]|jgi:hypothetical protein|nr:T9SS type A sorting domain-containing protein [Bacteroidales bacterium]
MKKFTFLLFSICLASFVFAQSNQSDMLSVKRAFEPKDKNFNQKFDKTQINNQTKVTYWSEDFENTLGPEYDIANSSPVGTWHATTQWEVVNREQCMPLLCGANYFANGCYEFPNEMWQFDRVHNSKDGLRGRMAYLNGVVQLHNDQDILTTISWQNIDLTSASAPMLSFYAVTLNGNWNNPIIKCEWSAESDFSTLLGSQNLVVSPYFDDDGWLRKTYTISLSNAAEKMIYLRFYVKMDHVNGVDDGYIKGATIWLDDLEIGEAPGADFLLTDYRVGFFETEDYHDLTNNYYTDGEPIDNIQKTGYFGNVPEFYGIGYGNDQAKMQFHAMVQNNGNSPKKAKVTISILKDNGEESYDLMQTVWTKTITQTINCAPGANDTIDIWDANAYIPGTGSGANKEGAYYVKFLVTDAAGEDLNIANGTAYQRFNITSDEMGHDSYRDGDDMTSSSRFGKSSVAWGEDMVQLNYFAVPFTVFSNKIITGFKYYIKESDNTPELETALGQNMRFSIETIDLSDEYAEYIPVEGSEKEIVIENVNQWEYVALNTPIQLTTQVVNGINMADFRLKYLPLEGENNPVYFAADVRNKTGRFNLHYTYGAIAERYDLDYIPCIHMVYDYETAAPTTEVANFSIYPNPANTELIINNVENQTIEILNITGQVVERINNANQIQSVNLSNYANGTYFVKVNNHVEKVNVIK